MYIKMVQEESQDCFAGTKSSQVVYTTVNKSVWDGTTVMGTAQYNAYNAVTVGVSEGVLK